MNGLIVAAGQGVRLREKGSLKPLIHLKGVPLIERVIGALRVAGVTKFYVVSGYRGDELRRELDLFSVREGLPISHIVNERWSRANGVSVLAAKQYLDEPFLLTMCDHLVDPEIYRQLIDITPERETVTLGVDFDIDNPLNDPEDVTRVKCTEGRIEQIGKVIKDFNAIDTGVFRCDPIMFAALEESQQQGDDTISGGIMVLARWKKALALDVTGLTWVDVDDPRAFMKAEALLEAQHFRDAAEPM